MFARTLLTVTIALSALTGPARAAFVVDFEDLEPRQITQFAIGGQDLVLVPEPTTVVLLTGGLLALIVQPRRARRRTD